MSLFEEIKSQYIDDSGKTRMLNYSDGISLMIPPMAPRNIETNGDVYFPTKEKALEFIQNRGLKIEMQDGDKNGIQGLWLEGYSYIPIEEKSEAIPNIDFAPQYMIDPLISTSESKLKEMQLHRKIAEFLKQYTLFEFSMRNAKDEEFGQDSFVLYPEYRYENIDSLEKRLIPDNNVMYDDGKLIVPSEKVREGLLNYLKIKRFNDEKGVNNFKDRKMIENYYQNLTDFKTSDGQLIFMDRSSAIRWRGETLRNRDNSRVFNYIRPNVREAYFYRNINIRNGKLAIVQNVRKDSFYRVLKVGLIWEKDRRNVGYNIDVQESDNTEGISYTLYSKMGFGINMKKDTSEDVTILEYVSKRGLGYAALLFI